jgi:hypothetical protein
MDTKKKKYSKALANYPFLGSQKALLSGRKAVSEIQKIRRFSGCQTLRNKSFWCPEIQKNFLDSEEFRHG